MRKLFFFSIILGFINCSTTLLTKQHYRWTTNALEKKDLKTAVNLFPKEEDDSFITSMERAYLNLIQGKPEIDELIDYAKKIETRVRFSASREIKTFFYLETPEGYYASEHEIIWLHFLLSWGYSQRGEFEKAYVEAKISSDLLSNHWSEEGRFDDPLLRVILGGLWTLCGHWEEAQVDFRVAYQLDKKLTWASRLASLPEAPKDFVLVLGGTGPEPEWNPELGLNPLRGFRGLDFRTNSAKSKLILKDANGRSVEMQITPDSSNWYTRHQIRDNEIQDLIKDSLYGQTIALTAVKEGGRSVLGVTQGVLVGVGGIALGAGVIYLSVESGSSKAGEGIIAGFAIMIAGVKWGYQIAEDSIDESIRNAKKSLDTSNEYRFVRFLPEYAWVSYSNQKLKKPLKLISNNKTVSEITASQNATIVSMDYLPDVAEKK